VTLSFAGKPMWTFTLDPNFPANPTVTSTDSATIQYTITNQSLKTHTLVMTPIIGISQNTAKGNCPNPFTLAYQQSCTLNLLVEGKMLRGNIKGGPVVCQQGSPLLCYQPPLSTNLNITRVPVGYYLITPNADLHGTIAPNTPKIVAAGSNLTLTATPEKGYHVDQWLVDGGIAQKGGTTFTLARIKTNHSVEVTFTKAGTLYATTFSGFVYFSMDNGLTWSHTTTPSSGNAANSVYATAKTLYVGSADGSVYYSTNNGSSWNATATVPGASPIVSIYVVMQNNIPIIYAGTEQGKIYYSTNNASWTPTTNPSSGAINSIFITPSNTLYVGSGDGNIYHSSDKGAHWHTIKGPNPTTGMAIHNLFATNGQLYINTRHISTNTTLPAGTIDFEYAYSSDSLTKANPTWTLLSQLIYTLFVNSDATVMHAGTQDGYVYSLTTGESLGFITYSPITSLFFLG
ncbi:MAG: hypothetical protein PSV35_08090, partial [bacterium]|nr:hypothetical protein [bacterium]